MINSRLGYKAITSPINRIFTRQKAEMLAREWVGDGAIRNSDGGLMSADRTRRYRPAKHKSNSPYALTGIQANFERIKLIYDQNKHKYVEKSESNLHINIKE